ncbi:hypothetical protein V8F20_006085 [Naviculisporaceae sp. PSN 640]
MMLLEAFLFEMLMLACCCDKLHGAWRWLVLYMFSATNKQSTNSVAPHSPFVENFRCHQLTARLFTGCQLWCHNRETQARRPVDRRRRCTTWSKAHEAAYAGDNNHQNLSPCQCQYSQPNLGL